jgi:RNA polymerase sigma-70 factor (ECF subfamily)
MGNVPKAEPLRRAGARQAAGEAERIAASQPAGIRGEPHREKELIRRAQAGDVEAYEQLLHAHQQRVFAIVGGILRRSEDIEDVAQQVFLKVYISLRRFDMRSTFSTWLYKIAVNECFDYLRKKKVRRLVYEADLSEEQVKQLAAVEPEHSGAPREDAEQRAELRQLVDWLLGELPREEQLMLVLKEVEGLTVEEIAGILDLNVNTVKVRMFRARGRLVELYRRRTARHGGRRGAARGRS